MFNLTKKDPMQFFTDDNSRYPLLPLKDMVVFPNRVVHLFVAREKSIRAIDYAMSNDKEIFLSAQRTNIV